MATRLTVRFVGDPAVFRSHLQHQALRNNVKGTIRSRSDGTIEVVVIGTYAQADEMVAICRKGAERITVKDVALSPAPDPMVTGFVVLPTV